MSPLEHQEALNVLKVSWRVNDSAGRPLGAPHILLDGQRIEVLDTPNDHLCLGSTDGEHSLLVTVRLNQSSGSVGWARNPLGSSVLSSHTPPFIRMPVQWRSWTKVGPYGPRAV